MMNLGFLCYFRKNEMLKIVPGLGLPFFLAFSLVWLAGSGWLWLALAGSDWPFVLTTGL
jgi:hypothetical protein